MSVYYFGKSERLEKFGALELPVFKVEKNIDWVVNGTMKGWVNQQPQYYNFLYQTSTKHHAIIDAKTRYTYGKGWQVNPLGLTQPELIELKSFILKLEKDKHTQRWILDRALQGGFCAEMVWDKAGKMVYPKHIDFSYIRESKPEYDENGKEKPVVYYYTSDWSAKKPHNNPDFQTLYPFDPDEAPNKSKRYIVYYKDYRPDLGAYPYPEYMGGLPYIQADAEVGNFVYNNVKNGFSAGYIFNFYNGDLSDDQRAQIELALKKSKHGTENAGEPFVAFNNAGDKGVDVTPIQANGQDERYINLNNQIRDEIFTAHAVSPLVTGMKGDNGFSNNADEIRTAVENFIEGYVKYVQDIFNEFINGVLNFNQIRGNVFLQRSEMIKPQITENVLLQIADKKTIAKFYGLELPEEVTTVTQTKETTFSAFGINDEDYEVLDSVQMNFESIEHAQKVGAEFRMAFASKLEQAILDALNNNPDLKPKEIAEITGKTLKEVNTAIKGLNDQGLLEGRNLTPEAEPELDEFMVVYKYVTRNDVPPVETESRDFCKKYLKLSENRSFRIEDIQALSVKEGYDVFKFRGGWYHNPNTDKTTPYCRHVWEQRIVRKK
jgi:hypothetical protein